jgi:hypothetical protein
MVLVPFTVYAEAAVASISIQTLIYVGLTVDKPLPEDIKGSGNAIGSMVIYVVGSSTYGPTTYNVTVGPGTHYVILGIQFPNVLGIYFSLNWYRLRLTGAGTSIEKTFSPTEPVTYIYISFKVDDKGAITPLGADVISPGGTPIVSTGGGDIFGPGSMEAMTKAMTEMMKIMIPLMMFSSMMQMMMSMMAGMVSGVA